MGSYPSPRLCACVYAVGAHFSLLVRGYADRRAAFALPHAGLGVITAALSHEIVMLVTGSIVVGVGIEQALFWVPLYLPWGAQEAAL